jgi:DNA-binding MarR family transcriptional regulator
MTLENNINLEELLFSCIDKFKFLLFPDQWSNVFLDYSKNEILVLLYLSKYKNVNMTELSEYINAPLNTVTGVICRLEKKKMIERIRSQQDRRIVQITLTNKAEEFIAEQKDKIQYYFEKICGVLTEEERKSIADIFSKITKVLIEGNNKTNGETQVVKKVKKITIE